MKYGKIDFSTFKIRKYAKEPYIFYLKLSSIIKIILSS